MSMHSQTGCTSRSDRLSRYTSMAAIYHDGRTFDRRSGYPTSETTNAATRRQRVIRFEPLATHSDTKAARKCSSAASCLESSVIRQTDVVIFVSYCTRDLQSETNESQFGHRTSTSVILAVENDWSMAVRQSNSRATPQSAMLYLLVLAHSKFQEGSFLIHIIVEDVHGKKVELGYFPSVYREMIV